MTRKKTKRPNRAIYYIFGLIVIIISLFKRKVHIFYKCPDGTILNPKESKKKILNSKAPYIIVGNHHSSYGFVYLIRAFYPHRINFILARKLYLASKFKFFLKCARAIPKNLFQPDIQTIRQSFDILQGRKGILALYPEGQIVINGISKDVPESCGKLVKKMKMPVYAVRTIGDYFCDSTWRKYVKSGNIDVEISVALTPEQISLMTADEIDAAIAESIYVDHFKEQKRTGYKYTGFRRAEGLENILYHCPSCGKEFTIQTHKHDIFCTNCGIRAEYGVDARLIWKTGTEYFQNEGEWYINQRNIELNRHMTNEKFFMSIPVTLRMLSDSNVTLPDSNSFQVKKTHEIQKAGEGLLHLSNDGYYYEGTIRRQNVKIRFDPLKIRWIPYTPGDNFQIYVQDVMFAFHTKDPRMCAKAALVMETFYEKLSEEKKQFENQENK